MLKVKYIVDRVSEDANMDICLDKQHLNTCMSDLYNHIDNSAKYLLNINVEPIRTSCVGYVINECIPLFLTVNFVFF